jgi:hypothetical protein
MARTIPTRFDVAMAEPVIGRAPADDDFGPRRFGPAVGVLVWLAGCAALWGLFAGVAALL